MSMKAATVTQAKISVQIIRDGKVVENEDGSSDLGELVMAFSIEEGIDLCAMTAELVLQDAAGVIDTLTGAETWKIKLEGRDSTNGYIFQAYNIESRSRQGSAEGYIVQLVSYEFILNEAKILFGHTDVLFNKKTRAHEMVEEILTGQVTGGPMTAKRCLQKRRKMSCHSFVPTGDHLIPFTSLPIDLSGSLLLEKNLRMDLFSGKISWDITSSLSIS